MTVKYPTNTDVTPEKHNDLCKAGLRGEANIVPRQIILSSGIACSQHRFRQSIPPIRNTKLYHPRRRIFITGSSKNQTRCGECPKSLLASSLRSLADVADTHRLCEAGPRHVGVCVRDADSDFARLFQNDNMLAPADTYSFARQAKNRSGGSSFALIAVAMRSNNRPRHPPPPTIRLSNRLRFHSLKSPNFLFLTERWANQNG